MPPPTHVAVYLLLPTGPPRFNLAWLPPPSRRHLVDAALALTKGEVEFVRSSRFGPAQQRSVGRALGTSGTRTVDTNGRCVRIISTDTAGRPAAASMERLESGRATPRLLHSSGGATHTPGSGTNPDGLDPNEYVFDRFWFHNLQVFRVSRDE